jgi:UrcA family protein
MTITVRLAATLFAGLALTPTALLATEPEAPSHIVRYADLDLSRPAGVERLRRRIAGAVEAVCGSYAQTSIEEQVHIAQCRKESMARLQPVMTALLDSSRSVSLAAR